MALTVLYRLKRNSPEKRDDVKALTKHLMYVSDKDSELFLMKDGLDRYNDKVNIH